MRRGLLRLVQSDGLFDDAVHERPGWTNIQPALSVKAAAAELNCAEKHIFNLFGGKVKGVPPLSAIEIGRISPDHLCGVRPVGGRTH